MKYDIEKEKFLCTSCGYEGEIKTISDNITEYSFDDYHTRENSSTAFEGMASVECKNCGAEIIFEDKETAKVCPMCASTQIAVLKQRSGIPPEGIIPFSIDKNTAEHKFRDWVKHRWFAPNEFKKKFQDGKLTGSYMPFWTYDSHVVTDYRGEGGRHRTVTETDSKGNKTTRTVTDWYSTSGRVNADFDDILICAVDDEAKHLIESVEPFNTVKNLKPYSPSYLSGYNAKLYSVKADEGFETAKGEMNSHMNTLARNDILKHYDEARVHSANSTFYDVTYKHVLLPIWTSVFGYNGKTFRYVINGETGAVDGERPYSPIKITIAIIAAIMLAVGVFLFFKNYESHDTADFKYNNTYTANFEEPLWQNKNVTYKF